MMIAHIAKYFALVYREPDKAPTTRLTDIYTAHAKAKWEWLEYQAMRFRAQLGLDATLQVEEIYPAGEPGKFADKVGVEVLITDDEGADAEPA